MANGFQIPASVVLSGPYNMGPVIKAVQDGFKSINVSVKPNITGKGFDAALNGVNALNQAMQLTSTIARVVGKDLKTVTVNGELGHALQNVATQASRTTRDVAKLQGQFNSVTGSAELFGRSLGDVARRFGAFFVIARGFNTLQEGFAQGVRSAIDFQHEMTRLSQIGGTTAGEIASINGEIARLSTNLGASSAELAKVSTTLRQAGLSADEVKTSLDALAKTSLAPTFESLHSTTEGLIALRQQFGVAANDFNKYLGSINTVSAAYAVESADLITAIRKTGGAFKAASGDVNSSKESFNQLLGLFTSVRSTTRESADEIATGLRTIFGRLQSTQVSDSLKDMGINLRNTAGDVDEFGRSTEGQFVGAYEAIKRLSAATKSLSTTDPRFAEIAKQIGGYRQISRVIPLLQQVNLAQRAYAVAQTGANSLTQDAIKSQESYAVKLHKVKEEFFDLIRTVGDNKAFKGFVDTMVQGATVAIRLAKALEPLVPLITAFSIRSVVSAGPSLLRGFQERVTNLPTFDRRPRYASGGVVPGHGDGDTVPATLPRGSYVVRKASAKKIGYGTLSRMARGYASGGDVDVMLTPKEFVFDDKQAARIGKRQLDYINNMGSLPLSASQSKEDSRAKLAAKLKALANARGVGVAHVMKKHYAIGGQIQHSGNPRFARSRNEYYRKGRYPLEDLYRGYSRHLYDNASEEEADALFRYASTNDHVRINRTISSGGSSEDSKILQRVARRYLTPKDMVVYRGMSYDELDRLRHEGLDPRTPGSTFAYPSLISTSLNKRTARNFGPKQLRIHLHKGSQFAAISKFNRTQFGSNEQEMLLPHGSRFQVLQQRHRTDAIRLGLVGYATGGFIDYSEDPEALKSFYESENNKYRGGRKSGLKNAFLRYQDKSGSVNSFLGSPEDYNLSAKHRKDIGHLSRLTRKSRLGQNVILHRGFSKGTHLDHISEAVGADVLSPEAVGREFTNKAFMSTSLDKEIAKRFAYRARAKIYAPRGSQFAPIENPGESEFLSTPGQRFRVIGNNHKSKVFGLTPVGRKGYATGGEVTGTKKHPHVTGQFLITPHGRVKQDRDSGRFYNLDEFVNQTVGQRVRQRRIESDPVTGQHTARAMWYAKWRTMRGLYNDRPKYAGGGPVGISDEDTVHGYRGISREELKAYARAKKSGQLVQPIDPKMEGIYFAEQSGISAKFNASGYAVSQTALDSKQRTRSYLLDIAAPADKVENDPNMHFSKEYKKYKRAREGMHPEWIAGYRRVRPSSREKYQGGTPLYPPEVGEPRDAQKLFDRYNRFVDHLTRPKAAPAPVVTKKPEVAAPQHTKIPREYLSGLESIGLGGLSVDSLYNQFRRFDDPTKYGMGKHAQGGYDRDSGHLYLHSNPSNAPVTLGHELMHSLDRSFAKKEGYDFPYASQASAGPMADIAKLAHTAITKGLGLTTHFNNYEGKDKGVHPNWNHEYLAGGIGKLIEQKQGIPTLTKGDETRGYHSPEWRAFEEAVQQQLVPLAIKNFGTSDAKAALAAKNGPETVAAPDLNVAASTKLNAYVREIKNSLPRMNKKNRDLYPEAFVASQYGTQSLLNAAGISEKHTSGATPDHVAKLHAYASKLGVPIDISKAFSQATGGAGSKQKELDLRFLKNHTGGLLGYSKELFADATDKKSVENARDRIIGSKRNPQILGSLGLSPKKHAGLAKSIKLLAEKRLSALQEEVEREHIANGGSGFDAVSIGDNKIDVRKLVDDNTTIAESSKYGGGYNIAPSAHSDVRTESARVGEDNLYLTHTEREVLAREVKTGKKPGSLVSVDDVAPRPERVASQISGYDVSNIDDSNASRANGDAKKAKASNGLGIRLKSRNSYAITNTENAKSAHIGETLAPREGRKTGAFAIPNLVSELPPEQLSLPAPGPSAKPTDAAKPPTPKAVKPTYTPEALAEVLKDAETITDGKKYNSVGEKLEAQYTGFASRRKRDIFKDHYQNKLQSNKAFRESIINSFISKKPHGVSSLKDLQDKLYDQNSNVKRPGDEGYDSDTGRPYKAYELNTSAPFLKEMAYRAAAHGHKHLKVSRVKNTYKDDHPNYEDDYNLYEASTGGGGRKGRGRKTASGGGEAEGGGDKTTNKLLRDILKALKDKNSKGCSDHCKTNKKCVNICDENGGSRKGRRPKTGTELAMRTHATYDSPEDDSRYPLINPAGFAVPGRPYKAPLGPIPFSEVKSFTPPAQPTGVYNSVEAPDSIYGSSIYHFPDEPRNRPRNRPVTVGYKTASGDPIDRGPHGLIPPANAREISQMLDLVAGSNSGKRKPRNQTTGKPINHESDAYSGTDPIRLAYRKDYAVSPAPLTKGDFGKVSSASNWDDFVTGVIAKKPKPSQTGPSLVDDLIASLKTDLKEVGPDIKNSLKSTLDAATSAASGKSRDYAGRIRNSQSFINGATNFSNEVNAVKQVYGNFITSLKAAFESGSRKTGGAVVKLKEGFDRLKTSQPVSNLRTNIENEVQAAKQVYSGLVNSIKTSLTRVRDGISNNQTFKNVSTGIGNEIGYARQTYNNIASRFAGAPPTPAPPGAPPVNDRSIAIEPSEYGLGPVKGKKAPGTPYNPYPENVKSHYPNYVPTHGGYSRVGPPEEFTPDKAEIRRTPFIERWTGRRRIAGNNIGLLGDEERKRLMDQAEAMYGDQGSEHFNPQLLNAIRDHKADLKVSASGGLLRARERTGTRENSPIYDFLTKERSSGLGNVGNGFSRAFGSLRNDYRGFAQNSRTGRFLSGVGTKATSLPAAIAASYAPTVAEGLFGSVRAPKGSRETAATASAVGSAFQFGAVGAQVGAAAGGPVGAAVGAAGGAIYGFVSTMREAKNEINAIKFEESFKKVDGVINGVADGLLDLKSNLSKVHEGISLKTNEAARQVATSDSSGNFFDRNLAKFFGETSGGDRFVRRTLGGDPLEKYKQEAVLRQQKTSELLTPELPALQQIAGKIAETTKIGPGQTGAGSKGERAAAFDQNGGKEILYTLSRIIDMPVDQLRAEYDKIIVSTNKARLEQESNTKSVNLASIQFNKFSRLGEAVEAASTSILGLRAASDNISSRFDGGVNAARVTGFAESATQIGGPDKNAFGNTVDFVKSGLGGAGGDFGKAITEIDQIKRELSGKITEAVHGGSFNEEGITGDIAKAFHGYSGESRTRLDAASQGISGQELLRRSVENPEELAKDLIQKAFGDIPKIHESLTAGLQDHANRNASQYERAFSMQNEQGATLDQQSGQSLSVLRATAALKTARTGVHSDLTLDQLNAPYGAVQRRLAGPNVSDASNPTLITNRFRDASKEFDQQQKVVSDSNTTKEAREAAIKRSAGLSSEMSNLQSALKHLADTTSRVAAIQEKLADVERERSGQFGFAEKLATSDPSQLRQIQKASALSDYAVGQGHFNNFNAASRSAVLEHLSSLQDVKLPGYGNRTGGEVREGLLNQFRGVVFGDQAGRVDNKRLGLLKKGQEVEGEGGKALGALADLQKGVNEDFIKNLRDTNTAFLTRLKDVLAQASLRDAEQEANRALLARDKVAAEHKAGLELNATFGVSPTDDGRKRAGSVLNSADFAPFKASIEEVDRLKGADRGLSRIGVQFGTAKNGIADLFGTAVPASFKHTDDPEKFHEQFDKVTKALEHAADDIGGKVGLSGKFVRENVIPGVQTAFTNANRNGNNFDVGDALLGATRNGVNQQFKTAQQTLVASRSKLARNVYGIDNLNPEQAGNLDNSARNSEYWQRRFKESGTASTPNESAEKTRVAEERYAEATNKLAAFREQMAQASPAVTKASGGSIFKPKGTDTVPAMLSPNEFVVNARSAKANRGILEKINGAKGPVYRAEGGDALPAPYRGALNTGKSVKQIIEEQRAKDIARQAVGQSDLFRGVKKYDEGLKSRAINNLGERRYNEIENDKAGREQPEETSFGPAHPMYQDYLSLQSSIGGRPAGDVTYRAQQRGIAYRKQKADRLTAYRAAKTARTGRAVQRSRNLASRGRGGVNRREQGAYGYAGVAAMWGMNPNIAMQQYAYGANAQGARPIEGFEPRGTDTIPAMLTPGEAVINARSARQHRQLVQMLNGRKPEYHASGGFVGGDAGAGAGSGGGITGLSQFTKAIQEFQAPANGLANAIHSLANVGQQFAKAAESMAAVGRMAESLKPFVDAAMQLAKTFSTVSIPSVIKLESKNQIEVLINGAQVIAAIKGDLAGEITKSVLTEMEAKLPKMVANLPAR